MGGDLIGMPNQLQPAFVGTHLLIGWQIGRDHRFRSVLCTKFPSQTFRPMCRARASLAVIARGPIERLVAFKKERGWRYLPLYSSGSNSFNRDYANEDPDAGDNPAFNVFTRSGGTLRHFWGDEMGPQTADPGQDPRGAPDPMPLWTMLDLTPGGRGTDWYPKLEYAASRV